MAQANIFLRGLRYVWRGLDFLRKFLHLLLLIVLFSAVLGAFSSSVPQLPGQAALLISPNGYLVEELDGDSLSRALDELQGNPVQQTRVRDVTEGLKWAREDSSIEAVVLDLDGLLGGGPTKLEAVGRALRDFRESGKPVYAFGSFYTQQAYYIAAHADEIWMNQNGGILFDGYGIFRSYYKDAIDKLAIDWNVFRVGTHKSYAEPFMRNDMSEEARESATRWLTQIWDQYRSDIENARGTDPMLIERFANDLDTVLAEHGGDWAAAALDAGLIDRIASRPEMRAAVIEVVGEDRREKGVFRAVDLASYVRSKRSIAPGTESKANNVAVVIASGPVVDGRAPPGQIGGDSTAELIRRARTDTSVAALVLRVDSGGGSVFASDVIQGEILAFKATGRPLVASMGSVAASAGYWMSAPADAIYAQPTTITGSIGVVGMFPTFENSLARLGIHSDGVGTTALSGELRLDRSLSDRSKRIIQAFVEQDYDRFVDGVATHRGMERDAVDAIAQGKVWSGRDALELGLIDEFGTLENAIQAAAGLAGVGESEFGVKYIEQELTPMQEFLSQVAGSSARMGIGSRGRSSSATERVFDTVRGHIESLGRFNDPRGVYSECFCALR